MNNTLNNTKSNNEVLSENNIINWFELTDEELVNIANISVCMYKVQEKEKF